MLEKKKVYNTAPLPFMGQKRRFLKDFKNALQACPGTATYVDLFGGSGLLAHNVKALYPDAEVVYNDYDGYSARIANIPNTNKLLQDLRDILKDWPRGQRVTGDVRDQVLERLQNEPGDVDYITLSASLLFSMKYVQSYDEIKSETLYNRIKKEDYNADGYLDGLKVVSCDYRQLFNNYSSTGQVIYLVDPPYLSTETGTYKNYWKLSDYLNVLDVLDGHPYFYFTSNKSSILELCDWIETKTGHYNPFRDATRTEVSVQLTYNSTYTDIMMHKGWDTTYS